MCEHTHPNTNHYTADTIPYDILQTPSSAHNTPLLFLDVFDVFAPRGDILTPKRSTPGRSDCTHFCHLRVLFLPYWRALHRLITVKLYSEETSQVASRDFPARKKMAVRHVACALRRVCAAGALRPLAPSGMVRLHSQQVDRDAQGKGPQVAEHAQEQGTQDKTTHFGFTTVPEEEKQKMGM